MACLFIHAHTNDLVIFFSDTPFLKDFTCEMNG